MNPATWRHCWWCLLSMSVLSLANLASAQPGLEDRPRVQVRFAAPAGMRVGFQSATGAFEKEPRIEVPGRINLRAGCTYRLKLSDIPNRPGVNLYPTLAIRNVGQETAALLTHLAVPVELTDEDFDHVTEGQVITKVIFAPSRGADSPVGIGATTSYGAGGDAVLEARRQGTILAVLRMGNIDLEAPGARP